MSSIQIEIPDSAYANLARLAEREKLSIVDYASRAFQKTILAEMDREYLEERSARGDIRNLRRRLANAPDTPPISGDDLPENWKDKPNKH